VVTVDLDASTITAEATGKVYSFKPLGEVRPVVDAGGYLISPRKRNDCSAVNNLSRHFEKPRRYSEISNFHSMRAKRVPKIRQV